MQYPKPIQANPSANTRGNSIFHARAFPHPYGHKSPHKALPGGTNHDIRNYRRAAMLRRVSCLLFIAMLALLSSCTPETSSQASQRIDSYFSPDGGACAAMIRALGQAEEEILIALYYFTEPMLADAVVEAHIRGCLVRVVLDKSQRTHPSSQSRRLLEAGIQVHFDSRSRLMHNKFCVIDRVTVITGSQNWTKSAEEKNAENTLILRNNPSLAERYRSVFYELYRNAAPGKTRDEIHGNVVKP